MSMCFWLVLVFRSNLQLTIYIYIYIWDRKIVVRWNLNLTKSLVELDKRLGWTTLPPKVANEGLYLDFSQGIQHVIIPTYDNPSYTFRGFSTSREWPKKWLRRMPIQQAVWVGWITFESNRWIVSYPTKTTDWQAHEKSFTNTHIGARINDFFKWPF